MKKIFGFKDGKVIVDFNDTYEDLQEAVVYTIPLEFVKYNLFDGLKNKFQEDNLFTTVIYFDFDTKIKNNPLKSEKGNFTMFFTKAVDDEQNNELIAEVISTWKEEHKQYISNFETRTFKQQF